MNIFENAELRKVKRDFLKTMTIGRRKMRGIARQPLLETMNKYKIGWCNSCDKFHSHDHFYVSQNIVKKGYGQCKLYYHDANKTRKRERIRLSIKRSKLRRGKYNPLMEFNRIAVAVCDANAISVEQMRSKSRKKVIAHAKKIFCHISLRANVAKMMDIAEYMHFGSHASVIHGDNEIIGFMEVYPKMREEINAIYDGLYGGLKGEMNTDAPPAFVSLEEYRKAVFSGAV